MTDRKTVLAVILFLGATTLVLIGGALFLTNRVIGQAERGPVDPSAVAALAGVTGLTGTALGALASLLVSTRSTPDATPSAPPDRALPGDPPR